MKFRRSAICLILTLVMLLSMIPLGGAALAATEITSIELSTSDYIEPSVGMTVPRSGVTVTGVNGSSSLRNVVSVSGEWTELTENGGSVTATDTFRLGREYHYSIRVIISNSSYTMTGGVSIYINGSLVRTVNGSSLRQYWCVMKSVTFEGGTFTVTYLPGSNGTGAKRTQTKEYGKALTLLGGIYTRSGYIQKGWSRSDGGSKTYDLNGAYNGEFDLTLYPYWEKENAVTVNSITLNIQGYDDPADGMTVPTVTVSVTGINGSAAPSGVFTASGSWRMRASNGGYTLVEAGSKFEAGKTYGFDLDLTLRNSDDYILAGTVDVIANGTTMRLSRSQINSSGGIIIKEVKVPVTVSSVSVSNITAPAAGNLPTYTGSVGDSSKYKIADYTNSYGYKNGILWYDITAGKSVTGTERFTAGHTYRVTVFLEPVTGYAFPSNKSTVKATLNGASVSVTAVSGLEKYIAISREYTLPPVSYKKGDVDRNGSVNNADLILIARYVVRLVSFDSEAFKLGDMDNSGTIDNADIIRLARQLVGLG